MTALGDKPTLGAHPRLFRSTPCSAPSGNAADKASVRQKKTGRPVKFEITEATRQALDDYLRATGKKPRATVCSPAAGRRTAT
jgi:hypothetical protein